MCLQDRQWARCSLLQLHCPRKASKMLQLSCQWQGELGTPTEQLLKRQSLIPAVAKPFCLAFTWSLPPRCWLASSPPQSRESFAQPPWLKPEYRTPNCKGCWLDRSLERDTWGPGGLTLHSSQRLEAIARLLLRSTQCKKWGLGIHREV